MYQIVSQHQCPSEDSFSKDAMSASEEKQISSALLLKATLRIPDLFVHSDSDRDLAHALQFA